MNDAYPQASPAGASTRLARLAMLAILLLAFALRAWGLDLQSLWSDEGISILRSSQALPDLLRNMPLEHTPGYFVLLHIWLLLAGKSDYALRYLSLLPSVLAVALIFRLGLALHAASNPAAHGAYPPAGTPRRVTWLPGALTALMAALLLATNGFQVWYAQEGRMYAWLLAAALASCLAQWQVLEGRSSRGGWWAGLYALATAGAVYLHLFGALLPLAQALFALVWLLVRRNGRRFLVWLAAALGALLLFAPWLPRTLGIFGFEGWREGGDAAQLPLRYWLAYTVSEGASAPWRLWLAGLYLLLAIGGVVYWWRAGRLALLYLLLALLGPFAAALALAVRNPDYHERYTIYLAAPLLLLVAGGIGLLVWRKRPLSGAAPPAPGGAGYAGQRPPPQVREGTLRLAPALALAALLLLGNAAALLRLHTDTALHKPDYRGAAARIAANLQPGDVVLVDGPDPEKVFLHYFRDEFHAAAPVHAVGQWQKAAYDETGEALAPLLEDAGRVWEVLYFHPPAAVQVWLATQAWATDPTDHNGIRVLLYGRSTGDAQEQQLGVRYGEALALDRAEVAPVAPRAGDLLRVSTHWFVNQPLPEYKFSLRLLDAAGAAVYTTDYVPQNWFAPTNVWVVGQPATDHRGILLSPDLPPGTYRLMLRLYEPATGTPAASSAGEDVLLAEVQIGEKQP